MVGWFWVAVVAILVCLAAGSRLVPSLGRLVKQAVRSGDVGPVVQAIARKRPAAQPTAFNHSIRLLWDGYERRLAVGLVKELVERHGEAKIAQYWLQHAITIEPEISSTVLSQAFVEEHYRPEVAAQCGPAG